jgi:hypothetical protein
MAHTPPMKIMGQGQLRCLNTKAQDLRQLHSDVHGRMRVLGLCLQAGSQWFSDRSRAHRREDIQDNEGSRGARVGAGARVGGEAHTTCSRLILFSFCLQCSAGFRSTQQLIKQNTRNLVGLRTTTLFRLPPMCGLHDDYPTGRVVGCRAFLPLKFYGHVGCRRLLGHT